MNKTQNVKILIAGGGTGGHIYPALAVGNELKRRHPDWIIEFAGKNNAPEGTIIPQNGYKLNHINVSGFEVDYNIFQKAKVGAELLVGMCNAFSLAGRFKPDVVVGMGGFVCGPVVLAAHLKGCPSLIAEQNIFPGATNKILSRYADVVCTTFPQSVKYMKYPQRCLNTGNPVRNEFSLYTKAQARNILKIKDACSMILSFGGSQGAKSINNAVIRLIEEGIDENTVLYHVTGTLSYDEFMRELSEKRIKLTDNITIKPYADNMPQLVNASDLIISRSGATSIAEINFVGRAAVYIPYPYAAKDHQSKNAMAMKDCGAAEVLTDEQLKNGELSSLLYRILRNKALLKKMDENSAMMGVKDSTQKICDEIEKLSQKSE